MRVNPVRKRRIGALRLDDNVKLLVERAVLFLPHDSVAHKEAVVVVCVQNAILFVADEAVVRFVKQFNAKWFEIFAFVKFSACQTQAPCVHLKSFLN